MSEPTPADPAGWAPPPCRHPREVRLPDGVVVVGAAFDPAAAYERERPPAQGLYLDPVWSPPWPHLHLDWPDMELPADPDALLAALADLRSAGAAGAVVEIGCLGGHGRTGTAIAALAVMAGVEPHEAVRWVRVNYCVQAVETEEQMAFVRGLSCGPVLDR